MRAYFAELLTRETGRVTPRKRQVAGPPSEREITRLRSLIHNLPSGTVVEFGTVAPGFGQAGGGVEALFPNSADNLLVLAVPTQIPDE